MGKFQLNKKGEDPLKIYEDVFKIANDTVETHLGKLGKQPKPISREFGGFDPAGLNDEGEWYDNPSWEAGYTMSTDELRQHNVNTLKDRFNAQKQGGYRFSYDDEIDSVRNISASNGGWSLPQSVMKTPEGFDALRSAKDEVISWIKDQQRAEKSTLPDPSWESKASEMEYFPSGNFWDIDSSYGVKTKDDLVKDRIFIQHFIDSARNDGFNDGRIEAYQLKQDDVERQIASYGGQQLGQRDQDGDLFPYFDVDGTPDKTWDLWGKSQSRNHNESRASEDYGDWNNINTPNLHSGSFNDLLREIGEYDRWATMTENEKIYIYKFSDKIDDGQATVSDYKPYSYESRASEDATGSDKDLGDVINQVPFDEQQGRFRTARDEESPLDNIYSDDKTAQRIADGTQSTYASDIWESVEAIASESGYCNKCGTYSSARSMKSHMQDKHPEVPRREWKTLEYMGSTVSGDDRYVGDDIAQRYYGNTQELEKAMGWGRKDDGWSNPSDFS